ncbi:MAG: efflux RND transporter periplasmic adaptor subunit [Bryobacterales bacterium]|nr:efflux RND transporter periplasmic adaptor subunit [Bryobacterales bacterium]
MNKIRLALKVVLPLFVLALGIWTAKALIDSYEPPEIEPVVVEPPLVRVIRAERTNLTLKVHAEGTVAPRTESRLVPEISGRVTEVSPSLAAGGFFDEGDVLLKLDTRVYELAMTRAEEAIERARLRLTVERQEAEIARKEWETLGTGEPSPLLFREPQIAEVQSSLAAAEAALEQASYDLDRTVLRAPFAGRVRSKQVDVGQFVQRGETLATLYSVDVAEVRLPIPNSELEFCDLPLAYRDGKTSSKGPGVVLKALFAGEEHSWQGRIVRTEGEIDPRTRMVNAIAQVEDPYARGGDSRRPPLAVGMFVQAEIEGNRVRDVIRLPRSAMRGENVVYVVDRRGRLRFRTVTPLRSEREVVLIREGLEEGDLVCVSPMEAAVNGMTVRTGVEGNATDAGGES